MESGGGYGRTAQLLRLLAHPTRLRILDELRRQEEACVCHLQAVLHERQPYISQQLRVLRAAGVTDCRKDGLFVYYRLADPQAVQVLEALLGPCARDNGFAVCSCPACQARRWAGETAAVLAVH